MIQAGPDDGDSLDVDRIARTLWPTFGRRVVVVPPGEAMPYDPGSWEDAIVFVLRECGRQVIGHQVRTCFEGWRDYSRPAADWNR